MATSQLPWQWKERPGAGGRQIGQIWSMPPQPQVQVYVDNHTQAGAQLQEATPMRTRVCQSRQLPESGLVIISSIVLHTATIWYPSRSHMFNNK